MSKVPPDLPWVMRTYSGHSSAAASNQLFRANIAHGQTGLSIAFDLPTQTGYDPDHPLARGEVGKVGVPVVHWGDMRTLLEGIDQGQMNTSMTINATAMWLLALYVVNAEHHGVTIAELRGTTQNDILKEYLSRGTFIFPPQESKRLIVDMVSWCAQFAPRWNPINICSYHLQEVGATPVQEISIALANAVDILDAVEHSGQVPKEKFPLVFGSISFFVNSGIRFVEEVCKMRAFVKLWHRLGSERYGISDEQHLRFRYGVQVNSLGLTENQPENNVQRIVLEMLGVTLSKDARARSVQLPAWNEALGLPRPIDQQWSLRMQQVLAYETDLLEYEDIFAGSKVIEAKTEQLADDAWAELTEILDLGGAFSAVALLKSRLVNSMFRRTSQIESGEKKVVGVNIFSRESRSFFDGVQDFLTVDPEISNELQRNLKNWRDNRDQLEVDLAIRELKLVAASESNLMAPSLKLARAGGTTGEWASALREVFGEYRAPTGLGLASSTKGLESVVEFVKAMDGGPPRLLIAKPGLDGHSSGAEQIAVAASNSGMEVIYGGIRLTVDQIVQTAVQEDPDVVGLSILSGSHMELVPRIIAELQSSGVSCPVVVGGIIPIDDCKKLFDLGIAAIFTPKDFELSKIMTTIAELAVQRRKKVG